MITITETLKLQPLLKKDQASLRQLMQRIYPPVYKHLWINEDCSWYLNSQYSERPFEKDLEATNANYYFLTHLNTPIGILRIEWDYAHKNATQHRAVKLHRLYIDPEFHGFGYGKQITQWLINKVKQHQYDLLWLEVMDSQKQALKFYERMGFEKVFAMRLPFERIHESLRGMFTMDLKLNRS